MYAHVRRVLSAVAAAGTLSALAVAGAPGVPASAETGWAVPASFKPVSASFLSATQGFALGSAGCSGGTACRARLAATTDGGAHWHFLNTPHVLLYSSTVRSFTQASRVSGVVFASRRTGWLYGPGLYVTHDGGAHWCRIVLRGDIVPALGGGVTAVAASSGIAYAVVSPDPFHGKRDELYQSPAGRDAWARVGRITAAQATFAVSGRSAWFATGGGFGVRATHLWATADGVHWHRYPFRCPGNYGLQDIAAASTSRLVFLCTGVSSSAHTLKEVLASSDGGKTEHLTGRPPSAGSGGVIAVPPRRASVIVLADSFFLFRSADGGKTWKQVRFEPAGAIWRSLSFATPAVGWVVLANLARLLRTTDAGRTWHRVAF